MELLLDRSAFLCYNINRFQPKNLSAALNTPYGASRHVSDGVALYRKSWLRQTPSAWYGIAVVSCLPLLGSPT